MCWHDLDEQGCRGRYRHQGYCHAGAYGHYGPGWRYYDEPSPEERREYLEGEKRALERRMKEIESRLLEASK